MYYKGEYAGRWPFFLMPHELYEGSKVELVDVILYRKYESTEFKEADLSITLSKKWVESSVRLIGGYFTYIKEKMGIPAERLLGGGTTIYTKISGDTVLALHDATYSFIDELTGRKVLRAIRIQGIASVPITLGATYDVSTGVAFELKQGFFSAFDPLSYVIPLSTYIRDIEGCSWFVLVDLRREEARITTTPANTTTSPPETPATPPGVTTPATQPRPAPPIQPIQPGLPLQAVDGGARGQEGLIAVELLTITLAVLSLTIVAAIAYRILVRQR
jgi:hypothetical protein